MSLFTGLIRNVKEKLMKDLLADFFKDLGEGRFGTVPKAAYWWCEAHAFWLGLLFGVSDLVLVSLAGAGICPACGDADHYLRLAAEVLTSAGLLVGFHAAEPPAVQKKG